MDAHPSRTLPRIEGPPHARGSTADLYRLAPDRILKLYRRHIARERVTSERRAIDVAAQAVPVPRVHEVVQRSQRHGLILTRLDGRPVVDEVGKRPWRWWRLLGEMAALHARLHALPADSMATDDPNLRINLPRSPLSAVQRARVEARVAAIRRPDALCHGDFHPGNLLRVRGTLYLIDWEKAHRGDPAADVARTLVMLRHGGEPDRHPGERPLRRWGAAVYLNRYLRHTPVADAAERIEQWLPVQLALKLPHVGPRDQARMKAEMTRLLRA